ncbi:MAG: lipase family protein [Pseudomonadota bacterium]|nr:lipase family protein [Pseudomonadota bacterium]
MTELSPYNTAHLAEGVYAVNANDALALRIFLANPLFKSQQQEDTRQLQAEVGGRLFRHAVDNFGVMAKGSGQFKDDVFIIFRGTTGANKNADAITDARIGICTSETNLPVHIGFNNSFTSMLPEIKAFLTETECKGTIHCIGHSLGGAVASLAADWASSSLTNPVKLYTYGAPRVGTDWFVKKTTETIGADNMHRVYHRTDPVPMVPIYPFKQAPYANNGHFLPSNQPLTSGEAHFMRNYVASVRSESWETLSHNPVEPYNIEIAIENWLKSKSPVDSESASFWQWVDAALVYVIKKIAMGAVLLLQGAVIGLHTIVDKLAYILAKGINLAEEISSWVILLMKKLMQALKIKVEATKEKLTRNMMRYVLTKMTEESTRNAQKAIRDIEKS